MAESTWQTCAGAEYPFKHDRVTLTRDGSQVIDRVTDAELDDGDVILSTANARGDWGPGKFRIAPDAWTLAKTERLVPAGTQPVRADSREAAAARLLLEHDAVMYLPAGVAPDDYDGRDHWECSCNHNYGIHEVGDDVDQLVRAHEAAMLAAAGLLDGGDEYHTLEELYEYRMLYNAHAATAWLLLGYPVVKSWRHADGEECFGGGWFIVTATMPGAGQVSNHYAAEHWDLFTVPEAILPPVWDGHTPQEAAQRLRTGLIYDPAAVITDGEQGASS